MIEEELKSLILKKFKSVRAFAAIINTPYSTINNIFSRGVGGTGISTIIPLCRALNLDVDALADEKIKFKDNISADISTDEQTLLKIYRDFNDKGKRKLLEYASDLSEISKYKKENEIKYAYRVAHTKEGKEPPSGEIIPISDELLEKLRNAPESDIE